MTKKIVALLLALVLVFAMTACAKTETPAASDSAKTETKAETKADDTADEEPAEEPAASGDIPVIEYCLYSNQAATDTSKEEAAINAIIEPLIGANIHFTSIASGDWKDKALVALQSGESYDIFFTADWFYYLQEIQQGLLTPLNDDEGENGNLLELYGQDILNTINPFFLVGTQFNGVNYAVPTNKELCVPMGWIVNADAAAEIGFPTDTEGGDALINKTEDWEPYMAQWKELHPDQYPLLSDGAWGDEPWTPGIVSALTGQIINQYQEYDTEPNRNWYLTWETEENLNHVTTMNNWYKAGYIHPDSYLKDFSVNNSAEFAAGQFLFIARELKGNGIKAQELVTASGNQDLHLYEIQGQGKYIVTTHSGGSMLAIPTTAEHPVEAMKYINQMHCNTELLDVMLFGVPEEQWTKAEDGRINVIDTTWYSTHGGAWTMGNLAYQDVTVTENPEKNKLLQEFGNDAKESGALGFRYVNDTVTDKVAAVNNIIDAYNRTIMSGCFEGEPAAVIADYVEQLKAAGVDDVKADIERQYADWCAAKGISLN